MASNEEWLGLENRKHARVIADDYYAIARLLAVDGRYEEALAKLKEADELCPLDKYKKRIRQLKEIISEDAESKSEDVQASDKRVSLADHTEVLQGYFVKTSTLEKLFDYQVEGLKWLFKLHKEEAGGILADDMGLGKTVQAIVLVSSLMNLRKIKHVLIIAPKTLLINWGKEFSQWAPEVKVLKFDDSISKGRREDILHYVQEHEAVLLTTYNLARIHNEMISTNRRGREFIWDYCILDEAHTIKNPNKTSKSLFSLQSRFRMCITGTPIQNRLRELWMLYDFASKGTLLGSYRTFKTEFETPIMKAREKNATNWEIRRGMRLAETLKGIYEPYFMRRTKAEVFGREKNGPGRYLPPKSDWVVWIQVSEKQANCYKDFLDLPEIRSWILRENNKGALVQLTVLKKLCDHPRLLTRKVCERIMYKDNRCNISGDDLENENEDDVVSIDHVEDKTLIQESGKLAFCLNLLEELKSTGHKTILFSRSTKMLDIFQRILLNRNWRLARLDGRITNIQKRDQIVRTFQSDSGIPLMLLTSQVGGVGLTLTAADRVIIYDPSWNPAADSQAIDRAYRIGQEREVIVYRLITCGTVEEKIYRRQVFKSSVTRQAVDFEKDPARYFSNLELRQLFSLGEFTMSETCLQLEQIHGNNELSSDLLKLHFMEIQKFSNVAAVSDHNALFTNQEVVEELDDDAIDTAAFKAQSNVIHESNVRKAQLIASGKHRRSMELAVKETASSRRKRDNYVAPENPTLVVDISEESNEIEEIAPDEYENNEEEEKGKGKEEEEDKEDKDKEEEEEEDKEEEEVLPIVKDFSQSLLLSDSSKIKSRSSPYGKLAKRAKTTSEDEETIFTDDDSNSYITAQEKENASVAEGSTRKYSISLDSLASKKPSVSIGIMEDQFIVSPTETKEAEGELDIEDSMKFPFGADITNFSSYEKNQLLSSSIIQNPSQHDISNSFQNLSVIENDSDSDF